MVSSVQKIKLFQSVVETLKSKNIPLDQLGFYDHPHFQKNEMIDPSFLENYALFVNLQRYSDEYVKKAKTEIPLICLLLYTELVSDGRTGACIDVSMVLSRILEKEGYWNYMVKGALTIDYPSNCGIPSSHFNPKNLNPSVSAGHAWIVAPPFTVVDLTVKQQPYYRGEIDFLPNYVLSDSKTQTEVTIKDIYESTIISTYGLDQDQSICTIDPKLHNFIQKFKPIKVSHQKTRLKYTTTGISASEKRLEEITALKLNGNYGMKIYLDVIQPALKELRDANNLD